MLEYVFGYCENNTIFFAHNLTFDGLNIINNLNNDIEIKQEGSLFLNCEIYSLSLYKNNKTIIIRCSAKILPISLNEIAEKLNLPKKLKIDHNTINENNYKDEITKKNVIEYCLRDCIITQMFMVRINKEVNEVYPGWWI
jgi:hypothetical protein